ncbi:putative vacuolar ATPase assembly integral membrane protein Vma21 [Dioscorea sansibarensis]
MDLLFLDDYWLRRGSVVWCKPNLTSNDKEGSSQLSSSSLTLISGFLTVMSVNFIIALYIIMAMKELTNQELQPDPTFSDEAKRSITQPSGSMASEKSETHDEVK